MPVENFASSTTVSAESNEDADCLQAGSMVVLTKVSMHGASSIDVGQGLTGALQSDVIIGRPIFLGQGNTSPVVSITSMGEGYQIQTATSIYELRPAEAQSSPTEKTPPPPSPERPAQAKPRSPLAERLIADHRQDFREQIDINDHEKLILSTAYHDKILGIVRDPQHPENMRSRAFHFSGSDHQWKCVPGVDEQGRHLKGEEWNPQTHYVQSGKLHPDLYKKLSTIPQNGGRISIEPYLPTVSSNPEYAEHTEDFTFKEEYITLKNPDWARYQKNCQLTFELYNRFIALSRVPRDFSAKGAEYQWLEQVSQQIPEFATLAAYLRQLHKQPAVELDRLSIPSFAQSRDPDLRDLAMVYQNTVGGLMERTFRRPMPEGMMPDFSETNRRDRYFKPDIKSQDPSQGIWVEEYTSQSPEDDQLVWAMAQDSQGRTYIDNVYDPRVGMTDYGTFNQICNMGYLVYKPEDYAKQTFGIPDRYLKPTTSSRYTDINSLWDTNVPVIQQYKQALSDRQTQP